MSHQNTFETAKMTVVAKHLNNKKGSMLAINYEGRKPLEFSAMIKGANFRSQPPSELVSSHSYKVIVNYDTKRPDDPNRDLFEQTYALYRIVFEKIRSFKYAHVNEKEERPVAKLKLAPKTLPLTLEEFIDGGSDSLLDTMKDLFRSPIQFSKKDKMTDYSKLTMWIPMRTIKPRADAFTISEAARNTAGLDGKDGKLVYIVDRKERVAWESLHGHNIDAKCNFGGNLVFDAAQVAWRFECKSGLILDTEEPQSQDTEVAVTDEEAEEYLDKLTPEQQDKLYARLAAQNAARPPAEIVKPQETETVGGLDEDELVDLDLDAEDMNDILGDVGSG